MCCTHPTVEQQTANDKQTTKNTLDEKVKNKYFVHFKSKLGFFMSWIYFPILFQYLVCIISFLHWNFWRFFFFFFADIFDCWWRLPFFYCYSFRFWFIFCEHIDSGLRHNFYCIAKKLCTEQASEQEKSVSKEETSLKFYCKFYCVDKKKTGFTREKKAYQQRQQWKVVSNYFCKMTFSLSLSLAFVYFCVSLFTDKALKFHIIECNMQVDCSKISTETSNPLHTECKSERGMGWEDRDMRINHRVRLKVRSHYLHVVSVKVKVAGRCEPSQKFKIHTF